MEFNPIVGRSELPVLNDDQQKTCWTVIAVLMAILLYAYWFTLSRVAGAWDSPQYSHGFLIPFFALGLMMMTREPFRDVPMWHRWVGVGLILVGVAMWVFGAMSATFVADNLSFIPCALGVFVIVGGLPAMRWAGPSIGFLIFMYPLPRLLEEKVMYPLQGLATMCSNFILVMLGVGSYRSGNLIYLPNRPDPLNVAEQCSGLRMLTIFTALAVAMALIFTDRTWWERTLIVFSAIPIALAVNVIRITLTGVLYSLNVGEDVVDTIFHDLAGWIMMPMALGLLYLEIYVLGKLFVDVPQDASHVKLG